MIRNISKLAVFFYIFIFASFITCFNVTEVYSAQFKVKSQLHYPYPEDKKAELYNMHVKQFNEEMCPEIDKMVVILINMQFDMMQIMGEVSRIQDYLTKVNAGQLKANSEMLKNLGTFLAELRTMIHLVRDGMSCGFDYGDKNFISFLMFMENEYSKKYDVFSSFRKEDAMIDNLCFLYDSYFDYMTYAYLNHPRRKFCGDGRSAPQVDMPNQAVNAFDAIARSQAQQRPEPPKLPPQRSTRETTLKGEFPVSVHVQRSGMAGTNYSGADMYITSQIADLEVSFVEIAPRECSDDYVQKKLTGKYRQGEKKTAILSCGKVSEIYFETNKGNFTMK